MTVENANTQSGATGPDQATRHSAEHAGSYAHRPAPHLEPALVLPPDHLAAVAADTDGQAEAERAIRGRTVDAEAAAKAKAEREAAIDARIAVTAAEPELEPEPEPEA
jgi:hypothetical protein